MCCISWALVLRGLKKGEENGLMIGEDIPFGNGEGMHIARIESPVAGYVLFLLSLGIQEDEDRIDDWGRHTFW